MRVVLSILASPACSPRLAPVVEAPAAETREQCLERVRGEMDGMSALGAACKDAFPPPRNAERGKCLQGVARLWNELEGCEGADVGSAGRADGS